MNEKMVTTQEEIIFGEPSDDLCEHQEDEGVEDSFSIDYEEDLAVIEESLPELSGAIKDFRENGRYTELRALGLSPKEAYLATCPIEKRIDNRSHLTGSVPKAANAPSYAMSKEELSIARSLFDGLDDSEIRNLYKKVTK